MTTTHFDPKGHRPADNDDALAHLFSGPHAGCFCDCCNDARAVDAKFAGVPDPIDAAERDGNVADRYSAHGGTAAHGTPHHEGPSDKQMRFLARLADERGIECPTPASKKAASAAIDRLLAMPIPTTTTAAPAPRVAAVGRFTKVGNVWAVRVTGSAKPGDVVTVTKGDGSTKQVRLGAAVASGVYVADDAPKTTAPLADVPAGHYAIESSGHNDLAFYRVDRTDDGRTFVKLVVGGHPDRNVRRDAIAGILDRIVAAGTADAAYRYGVSVGRCCRCNRTLTDQTSRELGIGPECRTKFA